MVVDRGAAVLDRLVERLDQGPEQPPDLLRGQLARRCGRSAGRPPTGSRRCRSAPMPATTSWSIRRVFSFTLRARSSPGEGGPGHGVGHGVEPDRRQLRRLLGERVGGHDEGLRRCRSVSTSRIWPPWVKASVTHACPSGRVDLGRDLLAGGPSRRGRSGAARRCRGCRRGSGPRRSTRLDLGALEPGLEHLLAAVALGRPSCR